MSILIDALKAIFVISEICVEESKTHISSEKAMEKIREQLRKTQAYTELKKDVDKLAHYEDLEEQGQLMEQKHGQWDYNKYRQMYCSNCGQYPEIAVEWNYCPNCGAKMEGQKNEN